MIEKRVLEGPFPAEVSEEDDEKIQAMIDQAEEDIAARRVSFRWGQEQIAIVKRAAALYGVPYQTYLKEAALRQAIADLKDLQAVAPGSSFK
jgi:predicted DNA binding CopG/RHH family protein